MSVLTAPKQSNGRTARWGSARYLVNPSPIVRSKNVGLLLYAQAYMWFHKIADFRQGEMVLVYRRNPDREVRSQHRQIIEILIQEGLELVRRIRAHGGLIKAENGFSIEDIESAVEELRNTRLQWYGSMSKRRKEEILESVLDASQ